MWRPKNWVDLWLLSSKIGKLNDYDRVLVEAGADAILKALREIGSHTHEDKGINIVDIPLMMTRISSKKPGVIVFIPDDED